MKVVDSIQYNHGKSVAESIGTVCFAWRDIENSISEITWLLSALIDEHMIEDWPNHIQYIFFSHMDMRTKIATAKALAFEANKKDSPKLHDKTEKLLNYIDNEIRSERNRFIHDEWVFLGDQKVRRVEEKITIERIQAHKREIKHRRIKDFKSLADVNGIIDKMNCCIVDLDGLSAHIMNLYYRRWRNLGHAIPIPAQWTYKIHLSKLARETPQHQPQSSPL